MSEPLMFLAGLSPEAAVFLSLMLFGSSLVPFFLLVNADFTAARRAVDAVHQQAVYAGHAVNRAIATTQRAACAAAKSAALSAAALHMILSPAASEATR